MAVPTKGNVTNANPTPGANSKTQAHTQNTGSNRLLVVQLTMANTVNYSGPDFEVQFSKNDPANTISGEAKSRVSFLNYEIMQMMRASYESKSR